jgi:signal transduction histidine kinase
MVKKIIEALGGNVSAESKLGEGSTFRFVLPFKSDHTTNTSTYDTPMAAPA